MLIIANSQEPWKYSAVQCWKMKWSYCWKRPRIWNLQVFHSICTDHLAFSVYSEWVGYKVNVSFFRRKCLLHRNTFSIYNERKNMFVVAWGWELEISNFTFHVFLPNLCKYLTWLQQTKNRNRVLRKPTVINRPV